METLHRLAGVQDTSDLSKEQHPSHPIPEPPPIPPDKDTDFHDGSSSNLSRRASRASLPLNRQPSHKSFKSARRQASQRVPGDAPPVPSNPQSLHNQSSGGSLRADGASGSERGGGGGGGGGGDEGDEDEDDDDEFTWGPNHPCFPHPNPHCAPDSEEFGTTRVIRVKRDWLQAGDLYPQYANLYPEILDPLVSDEDFRFLISNINARLKVALDPFSPRAWLDSALGAVTGFVWDDLGFTGSKRGVRGLEAFIDKWNAQKEQEGKEVRLMQLRRTGFMALDFVIPDPGIDMEMGQQGAGQANGDGGGGGIGLEA